MTPSPGLTSGVASDLAASDHGEDSVTSMPAQIDTPLRGRSLLNDAALNKGTAFTPDERERLGLDGLLPARVETIDEQLARIDDGYRRLHDDMERHIFLRALQDTNEVLFYRYLSDDLAGVLPIVYTPTVGAACEQFSQIYRRPHGLFLSSTRPNLIRRQLATAPDDVEVIVVTDGERILGLGDQGIGGMGIPIGKLSLYTSVGGIDPRRTLPVFLDVGTNNRALLADPLYLGDAHERIGHDEYHQFVDEFVDAVDERYPDVLLQWEDFAQHHATDLLNRHRGRILSFNDDIQGTAAVALAAVQAGVWATGRTMEDTRVVIVGAGSAGTGIAAMLVGAGLGTDDLFLVDADGLLHDRREDLADYQQPFAQEWAAVEGFASTDGPTALPAVVSGARPSVLIGVSGQPGLFTEEIIRSMTRGADHPIVLPLSNPTNRAEATPGDLLDWTEGKALIATGSPFGEVTFGGQTRAIAQSNNIYVFPGLGLGALAARATSITDAMLQAAAAAVADTSPCQARALDAPLLPPLEEVRDVSSRLALAVAVAARDGGVGDDITDEELERRIDDRRWEPVYPHVKYVS